MYQKFLNILLVKIPLKLLKKNVVAGIYSSPAPPKGRALLYYKTDPMFSRRLRDSYHHTNNAEIYAMVEVLNSLGFVVDLVDRDATMREIEPLLEGDFDIYFYNAAGNSAPLHCEINKRIKVRYRIFYGAGPEPETSNKLVKCRHENFQRRTGSKPVWRRMVEGDNLGERFKNATAIFFIGNDFNAETYRKYGKKMFGLLPSTSPQISSDDIKLAEKDATRFIYFGGSGLICKGLDLVLEAFDGLDELSLDVCCDNVEHDFWNYYEPLLRRNPQIRVHGFIEVGSKRFHQLTAPIGFNVFPGSSEGCATSVVTCMRRGIIPLVTRETGVDVGGFGTILTNVDVKEIRSQIIKLAKTPKTELEIMVQKTLEDSKKYSLTNFSHAFETAVQTVLLEEC